LIKAKTFSESIIDSLPGIFYLFDEKGKFLRWNKNFEEVTGYSGEEISKMSILDFFVGDDKKHIAERIQEVFVKGKSTAEADFISKSGKKTPHYFTGLRMIIDNIPYLGGLGIDITERKQIEQKLKESEENYHQAFKRAEFYKDIFAHDINNLLQNIKSSMELLSTFKNVLEKSDEVNELTNIIEEQIVRGSKLVWNIRKLSQIEETEDILESVETFQVLKEAINFIQKSYHNKEIDIQIDSQIKQGFVQANELLLDLFENILFNAVKHNENPKIEISVKISKVDKDRKKYLKFEFLDNGIGVPDALKEQLFKDISSIKRKTKGMGLGLLLVSKILSIYNGQIWVEDKIKGDPSKGSNFIILLPEVI